ncbi:MAG: hypothetical protein ACKO3W_04260, partial [bacterium]
EGQGHVGRRNRGRRAKRTRNSKADLHLSSSCWKHTYSATSTTEAESRRKILRVDELSTLPPGFRSENGEDPSKQFALLRRYLSCVPVITAPKASNSPSSVLGGPS